MNICRVPLQFAQRMYMAIYNGKIRCLHMAVLPAEVCDATEAQLL